MRYIMKRTLLLATAAVAIAFSAQAAEQTVKTKSDVKYDDDGGYVAKSSAKQEVNGTLRKTENKVDVEYDSEGKVTKKISRESVTDPEGLGNKSTADTSVKVKEKDNGGYEKTSVTKSVETDGTKVIEKSKIDVEVDSDGNVTQDVVTRKTVDPKGLFNARTTKTETKIVNGVVQETTTR